MQKQTSPCPSILTLLHLDPSAYYHADTPPSVNTHPYQMRTGIGVPGCLLSFTNRINILSRAGTLCKPLKHNNPHQQQTSSIFAWSEQ